MSKSANTVVITGATSGIGLGLAKAFLKEGYNVVGTGRSAERLQSAAAQLNAGDRFLGVAGDVGKPESAKKAFEQAIAKYGKVDVLVNNAGIFTAKPFVQFTPDEIDEQIATNLKGVLYPSQAAAKHMSERKAGKIINITAALAMQPHSNVPALLAVALKGGINNATRALALELAPHGAAARLGAAHEVGARRGDGLVVSEPVSWLSALSSQPPPAPENVDSGSQQRAATGVTALVSRFFKLLMTTRKILLVILALLAVASPAVAKNHKKNPGTIVNWKNVPAPIQATIQSNAGAGKVKEVEKDTAANGVVFYCAEVKGTDGKWTKIYVNDAGVLMKTEPDNARNKRKHKPLFG